jgi:enoyl-CoA hydratase/carnithine racemase
MAPVLFELDERGVATITLNRPERLNAINLEMRDLLWEYFRATEEIPEVQAIVFRGEGRCFSAGADISEFGTAPSIMAAREARHRRDLWGVLLNHRCLTVAAMHGYCFGAGLELPLLCDLRIAAEGSTFALPEVTLGYIPSACGTQTLPRTVPPGVAAAMILTGEAISAEAALRWGLVDSVVPPNDLESAVRARVDAALAGDAAALMVRRRRMVRETVAPAAAALL